VERIQKEVDKIIEEDLKFTRIMVPKQQGLDILFNRGQVFKTELLQDIQVEQVSFYKTGQDFVDLCRGPHVSSSKEIGVIKLLSLTETHWQNNPNRPVMQRIAVVTFATSAELAKYLENKEKIEKLDFRDLGEALGLTLGTHKQLIFTPNGTLIIDLISEDILSCFREIGTTELSPAPVTELNDIFIDQDTFYSYKNRSYKELPLRLASKGREELATSVKIQGKDVRSVYTLFYKSYVQPEGLNREIGLTIETIAKALRDL
jgi:threonyl-tRNA synthetase